MVNKFIKIVLSISLFIASLSILYKFIIEPIQKEKRLGRCLASGEEKHSQSWSNSCKALGLEDGCGLGKDIASVLLAVYEKEKEDCYKRYE
ncbi:MAG: hypothetical protein HQ570_01140 [Candidatus Omnitrophica bacterium]|nr:hypothetical protein [Candidatus Omnitrophota bacterium]